MKKTFTKVYTEDGQQYKITAEVRFDDECKNGRWVFDCCGQIQDDIAEHFPDLVPFFKWHLCSTDGPLHYLADTLYHASDKDCWGRRKGEPSAWERRGKQLSGRMLPWSSYRMKNNSRPDCQTSLLSSAPRLKASASSGKKTE